MMPLAADTLAPVAIAARDAHKMPKGQDVQIPVPPSHKYHKEFVAGLFAAMRLAFLKDDEALPLKLRKVPDPVTGKIVRHKFHRRVAGKRKKEYTFKEQWAAYKQQQSDNRGRRGPDATPKQRSEANRDRCEASRAFDRFRKPGGVIPPGTYQSRDALRASIVRGFTMR